MAATINPLAIPKGEKKLCELCQKPATIECKKCGVTFYCDGTHQQTDWDSIHNKVCELLIPIRAPAPFHILPADREHYHRQTRKRLEQLMVLAGNVTQMWLLKEKPAEALPAAQLFLQCAMDIYGQNTIELLPAYMLLAEVNAAMGSFSQAELYVSHGVWTLMKTSDQSQTRLYLVHRSMGRLYFSSRNYSTALMHLSNAVYFACKEFGTDSVETAGCYFLMATVFAKQKMPEVVGSLYKKVASIWHSRLSKMVQRCQPKEILGEKCFDEAQCGEADHILGVMSEAQDQSRGTHPAESNARAQSLQQSMLLCHCRAMLWFLCNNQEKALEFGKKALEFGQQCKESSMTESIQNLMQQAEKRLNPTD